MFTVAVIVFSALEHIPFSQFILVFSIVSASAFLSYRSFFAFSLLLLFISSGPPPSLLSIAISYLFLQLAISMIVSSLPIALPVVFTVTMVIGAHRLALPPHDVGNRSLFPAQSKLNTMCFAQLSFLISILLGNCIAFERCGGTGFDRYPLFRSGVTAVSLQFNLFLLDLFSI